MTSTRAWVTLVRTLLTPAFRSPLARKFDTSSLSRASPSISTVDVDVEIVTMMKSHVEALTLRPVTMSRIHPCIYPGHGPGKGPLSKSQIRLSEPQGPLSEPPGPLREPRGSRSEAQGPLSEPQGPPSEPQGPLCALTLNVSHLTLQLR